MPIGATTTTIINNGSSSGPGLLDLAGLKNWTKAFDDTPTTLTKKADGTNFTATDITAYGAVNAKGLTREQVMMKGGITGLRDSNGKALLNIDFTTRDGLAIWNSIAGADGFLSAREQTQALLRFDTTTEDGTTDKYNLTLSEATAGFQKLLANSRLDKGIAKSYVALNQLGEDYAIDANDSSFNENAAEVTTATNVAAGDAWGSINPTTTPAVQTAMQTFLASLPAATRTSVEALLKALGLL